MNLTAAAVVEATGGRLIGDPVTFSGVSIDSRTIGVDALFVPIVAERDGHFFIDAAVDAGAAGYLTARDPGGATAIVVSDTTRALADLGRHARTALPDSVLGITGSVGKTTTKDMLAAVLRRSRRVAASDRSFNNELGVPLTLLNARADTECVVVEMGARGLGHIRDLCTIARPTVGVVTMIALAHAAVFGDLDAIAAAKGELVEALPRSGTAVLNADDAMVAAMAVRTDADIVTFGRSGDVAATPVSIDDQLRVRLLLESDWGRAETLLGARGAHQVTNAAAAAAAALVVGATTAEVADGLAEESVSAWRMDLLETESGALILNDAYNANRTSTEAALRALAELDRTHKTAVLGLMAELGDAAPSEHAAVRAVCDELGIQVIAYGTDLYGAKPVQTLDDVEAALGDLDESDAVLIKGSRVNELERLVARLFT